MAHFIDTSRGLINLDHVLRIIRSQKLGHSDTVHFTNGDNFECYLYGDKDIEGTIIPAAPGAVAIVFYKDWNGTKKPEDDLFCELEPIIGWRVEGDYAAPVFLQALVSNAVPFLGLPDGRYRELCYDGTIHPDLETARESVLAEAIQDWERAQKREAVHQAELSTQ